MWLSSHSNRLVGVVIQCTSAPSQLDWHVTAGTVISQVQKKCVLATNLNHVLRAWGDKRCKGDYGSRRTTSCGGFGITALCRVRTGGMTASVFRWWGRHVEHRREARSIRELKSYAKGWRVDLSFHSDEHSRWDQRSLSYLKCYYHTYGDLMAF